LQAVVRLVLLIVALLVAIAIIATHGVRGLVVLMLIAVAFTVPRTRVWRTGERWMVRLTGSRRRAAVVTMFVIIGALIAVNVYDYVH
jgi:hypothetical protein